MATTEFLRLQLSSTVSYLLLADQLAYLTDMIFKLRRARHPPYIFG